MSFRDMAPITADTTSNPLESTFMLADTSDDVAGFFSRPQLIKSFEWSPGVAVDEYFNPWTLYFANEAVRSRLSNFHLMRCTLKMKVLVNSTPFYYGRLLFSYNPLGPIDGFTQWNSGSRADLIEATQRPSVIVNPSEDEIALMTFPYVYPKSALITSLAEWKYMGDVRVTDINPLRNANEADDSITVSIMCWAEDVSYSQPSSVPIPVQGEYQEDEPSGIISKPATTLARMAVALSDIPMIAPYAKATAMVSSVVASIATLFGYSRPRNITPLSYYVPSFYRRYAQTNLQDETDVLALDAKKEVTIDPRVVGCPPNDPMDMLPIAKKECYLTTFNWDVSDPQDATLYNARVTPMMYALDGGNAHLTPMAWLAVPFRYWRGSLKYRFEVVCSKFHRGRLRVVYDPSYQESNEYNLNYSQIVDIVDGCDFTIEVGWAQGVPYLRTPPLDFSTTYHGTTPFAGPAHVTANGVLTVYVMNKLTVPGENDTDVQVNVYVSACDDFELQDPDSGDLLGLRNVPNGNNPAPPLPNSPGFSPVQGNYTVYTQTTSDHQPPSSMFPKSTGVLIGATNVDTFYRDTTMSITKLDNTVDPLTMTLNLYTTVTNPSDLELSFGGVAQVVQFNPPTGVSYGLWNALNVTAQFPATTSKNIVFTDLLTPGKSPHSGGALILDNLRSNFTVASVDWRAEFFNGVPVSGISTYDLSYAPHWVLEGGASIRVTTPTGVLRSMVGTTTLDSTIEFTSGGVTTSTLFPDSGIPAQGSNFLLNTDGSVIITNTNNVPVSIYSLGIDENVFPVQGDVQEDVLNMGGTSEEKPRLCDVFFGEIPVSIRQLLKRYCTRNFMLTDLGVEENFPVIPKGTAVPQLAAPQMSLWDWYIPAFVGWKGSVRVRTKFEIYLYCMVDIIRRPRGSTTYGRTTIPGSTANLLWSGSTSGNHDYPAAAEIPWYSNLRFLPGRTAAGNVFFEDEPSFDIRLRSASAVERNLEIAQAIGEDFSTYWFLCTPVISSV